MADTLTHASAPAAVAGVRAPLHLTASLLTDCARYRPDCARELLAASVPLLAAAEALRRAGELMPEPGSVH